MDQMTLARILRGQQLPQDWQGPPMPQPVDMVGPPIEGMGGEYQNPAGAPSSSFAKPMPQQQQFPGPAFKPLGQQDDYRQQISKIMKADRLGRAMQAGEGGMSDALKLILTTGSAIRTGAPPVPNLGGDTAGKAMTDRTDRLLQAEIAGQRSQYGIPPELRERMLEQKDRGLDLGYLNYGLRERQGDQRLENTQKTLGQADTRIQQAQTRLDRVSEPTALGIGDLVATLEKIDNVRQQFAENPDVVGPVAGRWNQAVKKLGAGEADADVFLANVDELVFTNLYQLSGKQINESERADLKQTVFDAAKNGASFEALLDNYDNRVRLIIANKLKALKATGRNTEGLEGIVPGGGINVRRRADGEEGIWTPGKGEPPPDSEEWNKLYERIR